MLTCPRLTWELQGALWFAGALLPGIHSWGGVFSAGACGQRVAESPEIPRAGCFSGAGRAGKTWELLGLASGL